MVEPDEIAGLDGEAACGALGRVRSGLVAAEVTELFLVAHWADLHPGEEVEERRRTRRSHGQGNARGSERGRQIGADGTPLVAEFSVMELGAHLGLGVHAARAYVRDALNVRHRHPVMWARLGRARELGPALAPAAADSTTADSTAGGTSSAGTDGGDASGDAASGADAAAGAGALPRVWQAREVARMCAHAGLDRDQARWVDAVTTPYVGVLPWGRFRALVEAKIIEVDPAAAEARRRAAAMERFVRTGQSSEHGLKTLFVRANAGDVILFVAMADRIAQILYLRGDRAPLEVRKAKAVGIMATPARALRLLEEVENTPIWAPPDDLADPGATDDAASGSDGGIGSDDSGSGDGIGSDGIGGGDTEEPATHRGDDGAGDGRAGAEGASPPVGEPPDPETVGEADLHPRDNDADDPPPPPARPCPTCRGTGAVTGPVTGVHAIDPQRLLPNATLYLHMTEASLRAALGHPDQPGQPDRPDDPGRPGGGGSRGVARFEGVGPITIEQVQEFLRHTNVRPVRVLDLAGQQPVDGYQVPDRMREAAQLRNPACIAPWGTNLSRHKDMEHIRRYQPPASGGPAGQTSLDNLGPMSRFPHRVKTHGRWRIRQTGPGVYEWRSPHGYRYRVDNQGTHPLGKETAGSAAASEQAAAPAAAPATPGLDLTTLDLDALRGTVIWSSDTAEIYQVDCTLDLSDWQHCA